MSVIFGSTEFALLSFETWNYTDGGIFLMTATLGVVSFYFKFHSFYSLTETKISNPW